MTLNRKITTIRLAACAGLVAMLPAMAQAGSLRFFESSSGNYDYAKQNTLPAGFGTGEFTLELWVLLDNTFPIGSTASGTQQRQNWSTSNETQYSTSSWWWGGNFLLDGHNNTNASYGTFSLQTFNGGRLRWLFGDGSPAVQRTGGLHSVQNPSAPSLLDGQWHQVTLVRRSNGTGATLEMWVDGALLDTETSSSMVDMRQWWNNWPGFPANQAGWYWGVEKQAALGVLPQYEDYKGNVDEVRYWSKAKAPADIATNFRATVSGAEISLVGQFIFEGSACNQVGDISCITTVNLQPGAWSSASAPLVTASGDVAPPTSPANLRSTLVQAATVSLAWSASTDNIAVKDYLIYRGTQLLGSSAVLSFTDNTVAANTRYSYAVAARDAAGNLSAPSAAIAITTPAIVTASDTIAPSTPANLRTTSIQAKAIGLAWTASTDNTAVASYRIARNGTVVNGALTATTFSDSGLQPGTLYTYSISAVDTAGNRSTTATLQVTTSACDRSTWRGRMACR